TSVQFCTVAKAFSLSNFNMIFFLAIWALAAHCLLKARSTAAAQMLKCSNHAGVTEEQYTSQLSSAHRPVRAPEARVGLVVPVPVRLVPGEWTL
ncbi:MAG: hypothetical protein ACPIOQ_52585, partial [Promethearchaeia archaeon]